MLRDWLFRPKQAVLSGDVCSLRVVITGTDGDHSSRNLWSFLEKESQNLHSKISAAVRQHLGIEFEVRSITFGTGSIEMLVIIGTAYYVVSRYKNFVESIELLVNQVKQIVTRLFTQPDFQNTLNNRLTNISVSATWSPGPALVRAETIDIGTSTPGFSLLLLYFIVSHAAPRTFMLARRNSYLGY